MNLWVSKHTPRAETPRLAPQGARVESALSTFIVATQMSGVPVVALVVGVLWWQDLVFVATGAALIQVYQASREMYLTRRFENVRKARLFRVVKAPARLDSRPVFVYRYTGSASVPGI